MRYGSVCSGIEAATVAWHPIGWEPVFFSEIEKFPSAVLAHHYPHVPNLGDMTKFKEWPDAAIDLLVGGTPCQSFSVAGLRRGLDDPRGSLMLTYLAIADRYRPKWIVWENVPGVLSSNGGWDFGTFLGALGELGYGFAYRVLDAQYVRVDGFERAVPQRRRRVFVVGYLGDWRRAASVLLEPESMRRNPPSRREAGEGSSASISPCLRARSQSSHRADSEVFTVVEWSPEIARCVTAGYAQRFDMETEDFVAHTIRAKGFDASEDGTGRGTPIVPVAHSVALRGRDGGGTIELGDDVAGTVRASQGGGDKPYVLTSAVRRLTPRECERLQGFSDDYTAVSYRGKLAADGPRYEAIGNSMAVNVMRWLGRRIEMVENVRL